MSLESTSWFSDKTGFTRETVKKRLQNAGLVATDGPKESKMYETKEALPVIYGATEGGEQGELMRARTANLEADTRLKELKEAQLRNELAPLELLQWALSNLGSQISAILETIPAKLKRQLPSLTYTDLELIRKEIIKTQNAAARVQLDLPADARESEPDFEPGTANP